MGGGGGGEVWVGVLWSLIRFDVWSCLIEDVLRQSYVYSAESGIKVGLACR